MRINIALILAILEVASMGLDLSLGITNGILTHLVEVAARACEDKSDICAFITEQIANGDYLSAATTFSLVFPSMNNHFDDIPKLLAALSESTSYNRSKLLSTLRHVIAAVSEIDRFAPTRIEQDSYRFGSYTSVHHFRSFVVRTIEHWRRHGKRLNVSDILHVFKTYTKDPFSVYEEYICPNLFNHSDCDGYYFPYYAKEPINYMFGSLYGLAEELIEFYQTGAPFALLELYKRRDRDSAAYVNPALFMLSSYMLMIRLAANAIKYDETIIFC